MANAAVETEIILSPREVLEKTYQELIDNRSAGLSRRGTLVKNLDGWKFSNDVGQTFRAEKGSLFDLKEGRGILVTLSKPDSFSPCLTAVLIRASKVQLAPENQAVLWDGPVRQSWDQVLEDEKDMFFLLRNDHGGYQKRPYKVVVASGRDSLITPDEDIQTTLSRLQAKDPTFREDVYESGFMPGLMIVCRPWKDSCSPGPWGRRVIDQPAGYRQDTPIILTSSITDFFRPDYIGKYLVAEKLVSRIRQRRDQFEELVKAWSGETHCSQYSVQGSFIVNCYGRYTHENGFDFTDEMACLMNRYPGIRTADDMVEVPGRDGRWHQIDNFPGFDQPLYYQAVNSWHELLVPYPR